MDQRRAGRRQTGNGPGFENWLTGFGQAASNTRNQLDAASRGTEDAFTFGVADRIRAGTGALGDAVTGKDFGRSYQRRMAYEHAADSYDAKYYGVARTTGKVAGTVGQVALMGPLEGAAVGGARLAEATPLLTREIASLGGLGAAGGVGGQALNDMSKGRLGSAGDYLGSAVGGTINALTARTGFGSYSGAAGGATTSIAQDIFNKRHPSWDRARESALAGGALGTLAGIAGRVGSNRWTIKQKEQAGEAASQLRTLSRGELTVTTKKSREYFPDGKYTYPDQRTSTGSLVESKAGLRAKLSPNQRRAYREWTGEEGKRDYRVDSWLPRDAGAALAFPLAQQGFRGSADEDPGN